MSKVKGNYFSAGGNYVAHRHYEVDQKDPGSKIQVTGNNHHIFVADGSGSMWSAMESLATRFIELAKTKLIKGDTLTVLIFNQDFRTVFQQFLIVEDVNDYIERTTRKQFYAGGLTGFAKPINHLIDGDIIPLMKDFKNIPIKLYFMSDGYDNASGGMDNILKAFSRIRSFIKIGNTHVEGFGEYYDKDTLTKIARHMNGIFVHTTDVDDYINEVGSFVDNRESGVQIKVEIPDYGLFTFVLNKEDGSIIMIEEGKKEFTISSTNFLVVTYTNNRPSDMKKISTLDENGIQAAYASAVVASRLNMLDAGVEILSNSVKDPFFAEILDVSLTPNLFAVAEKQITEAITDAALRFQDGKGKYLKDSKKADIPQIFDLLSADDGADGKGLEILKPKVKGSYSPISFRPHYLDTQENGRKFGKFISNNPDWARLRHSNLVFDNKTANMSIQFNEMGTVEVNQEDVMEHNLQPKIKDITKFTRYILFDSKGDFRFKDKKGLNAIFVRNLTQGVYDKLRAIKAIHGSASYAPDKIFRIRLDRFPVINRSKLTDIKSADYGKLVIEQQFVQASNRVLNYFYGQIKPAKQMEVRFGGDELEALKKVACIDANGNYRGQSVDLNLDYTKQILEAKGIDYKQLLPEHTAKAKAGQVKTIDELSANGLYQLLTDAMVISSEPTFEFVGKVSFVEGAKPIAFNSIASLKDLKSSLMSKGNFIADFIIDKGLDLQDLEATVLDKAGKKPGAKLTKALKEQLLEEAGIDTDLLTLEDILSTKAGKEATKLITNFSEKLMLDVFTKYESLTKGLSEDEKVAYLEGEIGNNKARLAELSGAKFEIKLAYILGRKGFTDQADRFKTEAVAVEFNGNKFTFTPVINQNVIYTGSLTNLFEETGVTA